MRRPELDGLRGVAILLVLAHHSELLGSSSGAGPTGVTVFFVLSGYLITALLLREVEASGRVRLGAFYGRRARRLLPTLGFFLAVMVPVGLVTRGQAAWSLFYVGNWVEAAGGTLGGVSHVWSLAVEEQFYIVWPLVLIAVAARWGRRGVGVVAVSGAVLSVVTRVGLWLGGASQARLYFGSVPVALPAGVPRGRSGAGDDRSRVADGRGVMVGRGAAVLVSPPCAS